MHVQRNAAPKRGGGVIFYEPLLCNSYSLLVHVYLFSYGSLRHVKHMLQPLLLAQENKCSCTGFLQGAVLTGLCPVAPSLSLCTRFARSFVAATSFVRHPALSTTGTRPSNRRVLVPVDRAARDLAYHFYFLPVDRISWAIPYLPNNLWIQLFPNLFRYLRMSKV